jgi:hypothetical protein
LAEGVIALKELDCAEKFFNAQIGLPAVQIYWKREFWHVPVFRKSESGPDGVFELVDEPETRVTFDHHTGQLGTDAGLEGLQSYDSRRGQLQSTDGKFLLSS